MSILKLFSIMNNRILKQIRGFLETPPLFLNSDFSGLPIFKKNLDVENENFIDLENIHFSPNTVLGKIVEQFFEITIKADKNLQLLASNIQIQNKERTLGELDFIFKDLVENKILHVELMYKFYVYNPEISGEMQRWIGPNKKDSLLQKIKKVTENQFPLLALPETKEYFKLINLDAEIIQQEICFKAMLFIPEALKNNNFPHINKDCILGFWFHLEDFSKYNKKDFKFFTPEKQDWPINPKHAEIWWSYHEILEQIEVLHLRKKSPLIWIKKYDEIFERIIVVWW